MSDLPYTPAEEQGRNFRTRQLITYLIIFAIVMFFAGLTSAYVVSMSGGYWVDINLPQAFHYSTAFILVSSVFAQLALRSAKGGAIARVPVFLGLTLALGIGFTVSQFKGWSELVAKGNFVVGSVLQNSGLYGADYSISLNGQPLVLEEDKFYLADDVARVRPLNAELEEQKNTASSYFYALTVAHLAHLAAGLISLLVMLIMALMGRYSAGSHAGLWSGVLYWHFLGGLWVYLLLFFRFVH
ncbi:MAG: hypothetical protein IPI07_13665 [Flavobacteriales bacterium]|nr:hypothetical protein [Flavobacteriales bacterium]MBK9539965.1 hypothetical protein [Flavobacteriales bacterium]